MEKVLSLCNKIFWETVHFHITSIKVVAVQLLSRVQLFATPWTAAHQTSLSFTISWNLLTLTSIDLVMPSDHLVSVILFSHLQSFPASGSFQMSEFFASGSRSLELQLQHQSFQWIFRLISFRIDWFDLLAVQGTLKDQLFYICPVDSYCC